VTPLKRFTGSLIALSLLSACGSTTPEVSPTPSATLVPYHTPSTTPSRTPLPKITGTEPSLLPTATPFVHKVEKGETLLAIAIRYGLGLDQLLAANPEIDPRFLSIGQELRIPGPDGQPSDTLMPTSTPLPLPVQGVTCYPMTGGSLICLATLINDGDQPLEGLTAQISLLSPEGQVVSSQLAYAPLNLLPPGMVMPLTATFDEPAAAIGGERMSLLSAFESLHAEERYVQTDLEQVEIVPDADGRRYQVSGDLAVPTAGDSSLELRAALLATGLDGEGNAVGFTKWESKPGMNPPWHFSLTVFSLGPTIQDIQLLAEAAPVPEATP